MHRLSLHHTAPGRKIPHVDGHYFIFLNLCHGTGIAKRFRGIYSSSSSNFFKTDLPVPAFEFVDIVVVVGVLDMELFTATDRACASVIFYAPFYRLVGGIAAHLSQPFTQENDANRCWLPHLRVVKADSIFSSWSRSMRPGPGIPAVYSRSSHVAAISLYCFMAASSFFMAEPQRRPPASWPWTVPARPWFLAAS